jgi:hypothetical protein
LPWLNKQATQAASDGKALIWKIAPKTVKMSGLKPVISDNLA